MPSPRHVLTPATALAGLLLASLLAACGGGEDASELPEYDASGSPSSSTSGSSEPGATFTAPTKGGPIGASVTARPEAEESAAGATDFATWMLSLLMHTPRDAATTTLWSEAGQGCAACARTASAWTDQLARGQEFTYARTPTFEGVTVKAQRQGDGWFVQLDASVPRGTLAQGAKVLQSAPGGRLSYTFSLRWSGGAWQLTDFHVLGQ